jgi:hypothetical protein
MAVLAGFCPQQCLPFEYILALTNFFNLSNIHPVSRRSSGMVRTSQCFRTESPQLDGPPTLAAAEGIPYTLVPPASLIKPRRGCSPLDFCRRHKWHFLVSSFSLRVHESVPIHLSRSAVSPAHFARPLQGFGKAQCEAKRESKFRPYTQGRKSAAPSVTAS